MDLQKKKKPIGLLSLSFLIPFLLSLATFALNKVAPFGEYSILRSDAWAQYHPYLSLFRDTLLRGGSLEHTWSIGMGINFLPILSYYVSSPLYLLSVLIPEAYLGHFMTLLTVVKEGLAGLFFASFLIYAYDSRHKIIPFFAAMYALCAWSVGYYWNIIWLDVFALLPLLITGTLQMLKEGRFRLYVLALGLCFWCNYYLSFCCCIFVLLSFVGYEIVRFSGWKNFFRSFIRFGLCTVLALSLAAVLILPTLMGMQNTASAKNGGFPIYSLSIPKTLYTFSITAFFEGLALVTGRTLTNSEPTFMEGLPNMFCGFSTLIMAFSFLWNKTFSKKDRWFHGALLFFFILSCVLRILDFTWHGFHFPNMIPARFTFLFSFALLVTAFRGYTAMDKLSLKRILLSVGCGGAVIGIALLYREDLSVGYYTLAINIAVLFATAVLLILSSQHPLPKLSRSLRHRLGSAILALLLLCEAGLSVYSGTEEGLPYDSTVGHGIKGQTLYDTVAEEDPELFYRTEFVRKGHSNDGAILHTNAIDAFSSSALVNLGNLTSALGVRAWPESNSNTYEESSPFTNTLCGIKYLMGEEGTFMNTEGYPLVAQYEDYEIRSVSSYVGVGFMTDNALSSFVSLESVKDPFAEQNEVFRLATGLDGDLYRYIYDPQPEASAECTLEATDNPSQFKYTVPEHLDHGTFTLRYTMEEAGHLSVATRMAGGKQLLVYRNGEFLFETSVHARAILTLGYVEPGEVFELVYTSKNYKEAGINIFMTLHNDELLEEGLALLSDEVWNITYADDTTLTGTITAKEDGFFYSSVPYEPGWTATVDGEPIPIATGYDPQNPDVKLTDALIAFPLEAGTHEITMTYHTPGLRPGLVLSLGALALFLLLILCKKHTLLPDLIPTEKEIPNE